MVRKRLTAEEARSRILDAAVERLRQDGPQGLKLASLAQELGISHQAILHHFGNRDGLVSAVVKRALDKLEAEIVGGFRQLGDQERRTEVLLETAFEIIVEQGNGRLLTWLMLSYPDGELSRGDHRFLALLAKAAQGIRSRAGNPTDLREMQFAMVLLSFVVLASSVFEQAAFWSAGLDDEPGAVGEFREWVRSLVVRHLDQ